MESPNGSKRLRLATDAVAQDKQRIRRGWKFAIHPRGRGGRHDGYYRRRIKRFVHGVFTVRLAGFSGNPSRYYGSGKRPDRERENIMASPTIRCYWFEEGF